MQNEMHNASGMIYLGDAMSIFWISFGTHEIADYMGAEIVWPDLKK